MLGLILIIGAAANALDSPESSMAVSNLAKAGDIRGNIFTALSVFMLFNSVTSTKSVHGVVHDRLL